MGPEPFGNAPWRTLGETNVWRGGGKGEGRRSFLLNGFPCRLQLLESAFYWETHGGTLTEKLGLFL